MLWFFLAIMGAVLSATYYSSIKKFLKGADQYILASGVFLSSFIILFFISMLVGFPETGPMFYIYVLITGSINTVSAVLYFKALKITDLSLALPMISFTPIFLIFTSLLLLGEFPGTFGIAGIMLIVLGAYALNMSRIDMGILHPLRNVHRNRGILYMLVVAFLFSVSANFDKLVVTNSDPIFGTAMITLFLGAVFLSVSLARGKGVRNAYNRDAHKFIISGAILALGALTVNTALAMQIVPYVISVKRSSIMFSVLFGALVFKEKHILKRGLGAIIMLLGMVLIVLF